MSGRWPIPWDAQTLANKHRRWCDRQIALGTPEGVELRRQRDEMTAAKPPQKTLQTLALAMLLARAAK